MFKASSLNCKPVDSLIFGKPYNASLNDTTLFRFGIKNDLTEDLEAYWINSNRVPVRTVTIKSGQVFKYMTFYNRVWAFFVKRFNKVFLARMGDENFPVTDQIVKVSSIRNILCYDISRDAIANVPG